MLEPTNYLNNLNKRIEISSSEIGNVQLKESFVLNSRRNALDFSTISSYLNEVIVTSYSTLCSAPKYPKDAVNHGISGMTIATWLESDGNNKFNEEVFWFKSNNIDVDGRPCTIKESIQHIWSNLSPLITQERRRSVDLGPLENALSCLETKVERFKTDSFGETFVLNCNEAWSKQTWPLSKHIYEVLKQLTVGHNILEIEGLNNVANLEYPNLNWAIALEDLLDVDVTSVPPEGGDSLIWNEESGNWQPGSSDVKYITELRDVNTAAYTLQENDVLVWDPSAKDDQAAQDGEDGAWIPVASSSLFESNSVQYMDDLLDADISNATHGHVLTWDETHVDDTDPNNTQPGAWVPKAIPEAPSPNNGVLKNYEQCHLGPFTKEIPYSYPHYEIGPGESPVMFLFRNNTGSNLKLEDFSFTCAELYSDEIRFSFVKADTAQLSANSYVTISDLFVMDKENVDVATNNQGIGNFEGSLGGVGIDNKEYFGLLLNTYEKTGFDNSNFFLNLEATD
jgi:hypothetical protein